MPAWAQALMIVAALALVYWSECSEPDPPVTTKRD